LNSPFVFDVMPDENLTLYAEWAQYFTVTYNYQNATGNNSTLTDRVLLNRPFNLTTPTRTGYAFGGWYTGPNGSGIRLTNRNGIGISNWSYEGDIELYAQWLNILEITLHLGDGETDTAEVTIGMPFNLPVPSRDGFVFQGWTSSAGVARTNAEGESLTAWHESFEPELYALWQPQVFTITAVFGNGTANREFHIPFGAEYDLTVPTRDGYIFAGWYDQISGGTQYTDTTGKNTWATLSNKTLYARWVRV
jgi:uncharacterized repeat protein (TIGR02543 family)